MAIACLAALAAACTGDAGLAQQHQQAAQALERWEAGIEPPPWDPENPPVGIVVDSVEVSPDGASLRATFVGSPDPASQPCGVDYSGEAVESDLAVVVIIVEHRRPNPEICAGVGATRTTMITLAAPLGDRAVLDVQEGRPVEVVHSE
jgi:hypothetical protein